MPSCGIDLSVCHFIEHSARECCIFLSTRDQNKSDHLANLLIFFYQFSIKTQTLTNFCWTSSVSIWQLSSVVNYFFDITDTLYLIFFRTTFLPGILNLLFLWPPFIRVICILFFEHLLFCVICTSIFFKSSYYLYLRCSHSTSLYPTLLFLFTRASSFRSSTHILPLNYLYTDLIITFSFFFRFYLFEVSHYLLVPFPVIPFKAYSVTTRLLTFFIGIFTASLQLNKLVD